MASDPLKTLVVDEREIAREELATALLPYVRLTQSGGLVLEDAFSGLTTLRGICCLLLAMKASQLLGLRETPGVGPQELVELSQLPPGTVRPKLSQLARMRIARRSGGEYMIETASLRRALLLLGDNR